MIHFDFIVEDVDAETIFNCVYNEIPNCHVHIMDLMIEGNKEVEIEHYRRRIKYIEELLSMMHNSKVKE